MCVTAWTSVIYRVARDFPSETMPYADVLLPASPCRKKRHFYQHRAAHSDGPPGIEPLGRGQNRLAHYRELARRILAGGQRQVNGGTHAGWDYASTSKYGRNCRANAQLRRR